MSELNPNEAPEGLMAVSSYDSEGNYISDSCSRCALKGNPACPESDCFGTNREDGCEVYFVIKPEAA